MSVLHILGPRLVPVGNALQRPTAGDGTGRHDRPYTEVSIGTYTISPHVSSRMSRAATAFSSRVVDPYIGFLDPWIQVVVILTVAIVLAKLTESVGFRVLNHYTRMSKTDLDQLFVRLVRAPLYVSILLTGVYLSVGVLGDSVAGEYVADAVLTMIILLWSRAFVKYGNEAVDVLQNEDVAQDIAPFASNVASVFIVLGATILILFLWEVDITPFVASAGVLGIVVGFAARETLANFVGGVSLYFDDTYRVGDVIVLESGERGTVSHVGIRSTSVITRDNVAITVPNAVLNNTQVVNQSAPQQKQRVTIPITAAYDTDLDLVDEILGSVCDDVEQVVETPEPRIYLLNFGDSALEFELRVYTIHPFRENRVRNEVNRLVYERFQDAGVEIPFPHRTVNYSEPRAEPDPRPLQ